MADMPFMHVGVVVENLDEAIEAFGSKLGIQFAPPMESRLDNLKTDEGTLDIAVRLTYSRGGPPYIELIQAHESGIFGRENLGMHHIGMWAPSCGARVEELRGRGVHVEAAQHMPGDLMVIALLNPLSLAGMRVELIDEMARPSMEQWIAS
jgi:hypothetical protein